MKYTANSSNLICRFCERDVHNLYSVALDDAIENGWNNVLTDGFSFPCTCGAMNHVRFELNLTVAMNAGEPMTRDEFIDQYGCEIDEIEAALTPEDEERFIDE